MKRKIINIKNKNDLIKFYNNLKWYKTLFYKNTLFETRNKELQDIIEALNIKKRNKRIEYIYNSACKKVDDFCKDKNMCGFKNNKCYTQQYKGCKYKNGCCRKCIYQSSKGCTTSNLTCKLFNCSEVRKRFEVLEFNDLKILKLLSIRQRIILKHDYFSSREEVLKDLYIGSLFIFVVRLIYRYIRKNIV